MSHEHHHHAHHGHARGPKTEPQASAASLLRASMGARLGVAAAIAAVVWVGAIWAVS